MSFLHGRFHGLRTLYMVVSTAAILAAYFGTAWLHPSLDLQIRSGWNYKVIYPALLIFGNVLYCVLAALYDQAQVQIGLRASNGLPFIRTSLQVVAIALVVFVGLVLAKDVLVSRLFLLCVFPILWVTLFMTHLLVHRWLTPLLFRGHRSLRALVIAEVSSHDPLIDWVMAHNHVGLKLAAIYASRLPEEYAELDARRFGENPERAIAALAPQVVICGDANFSREELVRLRLASENAGSRFVIHLDRITGLGGSASIYTDCGHALAVFRREPLESPFSRIVKRCFDLVVAIPICLFLLPILMLMVAVIHRLQSPGPLFFRQRRYGAAGRVFLVWKFRTMRCDHGREGDQVQAGDERIFPAGHWLRKFSIDEFPQFLHVLAGTMSVVGPRPHFVEHDSDFEAVDPLYRFRKFLKPGVTGLAQVMGYRGITRSRADVRERSYADLEYLENWSLRLDLMILVKTAWQVIHPPKSAR